MTHVCREVTLVVHKAFPCILLSLACVTLSAGCRFPPPPQKHVWDLKHISSATGLSFPPTARLKRSLVVAELRISYGWATVTMDARDVELFKKTPVHDPITPGTIKFSKNFRMSESASGRKRQTGEPKPPAWWHPEAVRASIGGQYVIFAVGGLEVLITQTGGARETAYIQWIT